jgi:hypothetical protein
LDNVKFLKGRMENSEKVLKLLEECKIQNISNIYQFGSFLHNCQNEKSDKDFIIILNEKEEYFDGSKEIEIKNFNFNIYHIVFFQFLIQEQFPDALQCLWIPNKFVLLENVKFEYHLDVIKLKNQFICESSLNWNKASKIFPSNKKSGLKNIIHCFRKIFFAFQILKNEKIIDYEEGNQIFNEIFKQDKHSLKFDCENWKFYESKYKDKFRDLIHQMKDFSNKENVEKLSMENICILRRDCSLTVKEVGENLRFLSFNGDTLPVDAVKNLDGVIYDLKSEKFIYRFPCPSDIFNVEKIKIFPKLGGILVGLYYYNCWEIIFEDPIVFRENFKIRKQNTKYVKTSKFQSKIEKRFWEIFDTSGYSLNGLPLDHKFTFEMTMKDDLFIVQNHCDSLILVDVLNDKNDSIDLFKISKLFHFKVYREQEMTYEDLNQNLLTNDSMNINGYFCLDDNFNRMIIELPQDQHLVNLKYFHLFDDNSIDKMILNLLKLNSNESFLNFEPWKQLKARYKEIQKKFQNKKDFIENIYKSLENLDSIEFGKKSRQYPFYYALFEIKGFKGDITKYLSSLAIKKLNKLMNDVESTEL